MPIQNTVLTPVAHRLRIRILWRSILIVIGVGIVGTVVFNYFGVDGEFVAEHDFTDQPSAISELTPRGRSLDREVNAENGGTYQRIVAEPVYFSVDLPSPYPKATVEIEYQNPSQSMVELGLLQNNPADIQAGGQPIYNWATIENKFVENSNWERIEEDGLVLLQKEPSYSSISEFIDNPPNALTVGTWRAGLRLPFTFDDYQEQPSSATVYYPLRGAHQLFTYVKDTPLEVDLTFHDANFSQGTDPVTVQVTRLGEVVAEYAIEDDGQELAVGESSGEQAFSFQVFDLEEGVYGVDLLTSDDIIFTSITTAQDKLVVKSSIHLAGSSEYHNAIPDLATEASTLYTESDTISATAKHSAGVSTVLFNQEPLLLRTVDRVYAWQAPRSRQLTEVFVPANDVQLVGDHYFSTSLDSWFDPEFGFRELSPVTDREQLDVIISREYMGPERQRSWYLTQAEFDLTPVASEEPNQFSFALSAPGLEEAPRDIKVRSITVTATKDPITFGNIWDRIQNKLGL